MNTQEKAIFNSYLAAAIVGPQMLSGATGGKRLFNATGTYTETDGQQIGTFAGQPVFAKIVNGHLAAYTYDSTGGPLSFKPGHWVYNAGLLTMAEAQNFSQTDPATGTYIAPDVQGYQGSTLGKALSGGSTINTGGGGNTNTGGGNTNTGGGLLNNLLGGNTATGGTQTPAQKQTSIVVVVLIIAAVGFAVYYFAKKR